MEMIFFCVALYIVSHTRMLMRAQFDSVRVIGGHGPIHADRFILFPKWGTRIVRSRAVVGPERGKKWTVRAFLCVISFALGLVLLAMPPDHAMAQGRKSPPPTQAESGLMLPDEVIDTTSKPPAGKKGPKKKVKTCDLCQEEADALQTLLDAYFLAACNEAKGTAQAGGADSRDAVQQMQQLAGDWLGDGSQRKEKRDAIDKKKSDPNAPSADLESLKKQIQDAVKALQGCLPKCAGTGPAKAPTPPDGETTTTTPPPAEKVPALPVPIKLPNPPKCFENEKERQGFVNKWEEVQSEQQNLARSARANALEQSNDEKDPMYTYWEENADICQKSADDLRKIIDDADDPTKTPLCPKKGSMAPRQPAGEHYVSLTPSEQTLSRRSNLSETAMAIMKATPPVNEDAVAALHPCDKERFHRDLATLDFLGAQAGDLATASGAAIGAKAAVYDLMTRLNSRWDDTCKERPATRLVPGADVAENDVLLVDLSTQKEIPGGKAVIIPKDERTPIPPPVPVRADGRVTLPPTKPADTIIFLPEDHEKVVLDDAMVQDGGARLPIPEKSRRLIVNDTPCSGVTDKMVAHGLADQYGVRKATDQAGRWTVAEYCPGGPQDCSCVVEVPRVVPLRPGGGKIIPKGGSTVTEGGKVIDGDQPREIQGPPPREPFAASRGTWGQAYLDQWYLKAVGWLKDGGSTVLPATAVPVTVAVIDTGVDFAHPELAGANWVNPNPGPKADVYGWNFVDNSPDIRDLSGHGTIIAGIIAASSGEGKGIAGIDPWARIMALKAMELDGHGGSIDLSQAIVYAADHGARVINLSVGGHTLTLSEQEAIDYAARKNALVVVASGNEGVDTTNFSPAGLKNVLAVAAVGPDLKRQAFSNWGASIGIAAPGVDILSLRARQTDLLQMTRNEYRPGAAVVAEQYYRVTGSSFAASIVSGAASLLLSVKPTLTAAQVKRVLLQTARDLDGIGVNQFSGYGLLNIAAALAADPNVYVEAAITGVSAVQVRGRTMLRVTGTADGDSLKEARIDIGRGDNPVRWTTVVGATNRPVVNGTLGELPADAFSGGKQWTVRIVVVDRNGLTREARFKLTLG